jgi:hypothetical protein
MPSCEVTEKTSRFEALSDGPLRHVAKYFRFKQEQGSNDGREPVILRNQARQEPRQRSDLNTPGSKRPGNAEQFLSFKIAKLPGGANMKLALIFGSEPRYLSRVTALPIIVSNSNNWVLINPCTCKLPRDPLSPERSTS